MSSDLQYVMSAAGDDSYRLHKTAAGEWEIRHTVSANVVWRADDVSNDGLSFDEAVGIAESDGFELVGVAV